VVNVAAQAIISPNVPCARHVMAVIDRPEPAVGQQLNFRYETTKIVFLVGDVDPI
jgi:hypothetical protein